MHDLEDDILEITLNLLVDDRAQTLAIPIPFDYDGEGILALVMADMEPPATIADANLDALKADGTVRLEGAMGADALDNWRQRANGLQEIDLDAILLDDAGLTPGIWPGIDDERTGEPSAVMLDETIEHDLANAAIAGNETKAAFRAMREASGASQAALAEALGVNVRAVKRWETPGQPEPPRDAWRLVRAWRNDALSGANWHVRQAEQLRDDFHEAYILTLYRNQEEFDRDLSPLLAQAPSHRWQDAVAQARREALAEGGDGSHLEISHSYTNFPGTRSYWRANAAARTAAIFMEARGIAYGFAYPDERASDWGGSRTWVPRADVQRIETPDGAIIACGMR